MFAGSLMHCFVDVRVDVGFSAPKEDELTLKHK